MTQNQYDYIIIGAGHNGLVAAAYLAQQGKKVLVLERREVVGGQVVTESFGDGFIVDSIHAGGTLRPDIIKDLKLGLDMPSAARPAFISLQPDGKHFVLDSDPAKAAESIRHFSEKDAANWKPFLDFMGKASRFIHQANATIMPRLPKGFNLSEGLDLAKLGINVRMLGSKDMMRIIRGIPMTVEEFVDEWFESDVVKGAIAALGIHGFTLGPMGAGTGYTLMHNWANRGGLAHGPSPRLWHPSPLGRGDRGEGKGQGVRGIGQITSALANAVKAFGGEIRTNAEVEYIQLDTYTCKGVVLKNGEEIPAKNIISAVDPKRTFLTLVGAVNLPPEFVWNVQSIKMRGSVAKVHLLTDGKHGIPDGTVALAPSIKYLEHAYDAAKYHQISEQPYLEVTTSVSESVHPLNQSVVSIHFQFAPYKLKNGSWNMENGTIEKIAIDRLGEYFPNLKSSIKNQKSLSPLDLEQTYGLTEGDLNHGQLMLDQFTFMRPIPGWSNHKTPIDNLYLCGSGVHGGGGVSGAAGRNVVRIVS